MWISRRTKEIASNAPLTSQEIHVASRAHISGILNSNTGDYFVDLHLPCFFIYFKSVFYLHSRN